MQASIYIGIAAIADFFDGFVARLLNAYSDIGKQLDSLADVVSFGVAPGMILYYLSAQCFNSQGFSIFIYFPFIVPIFSAIRLAKFNVDLRQSDFFIGLPTPANAMFIASLPFVMAYNSSIFSYVITHPYFLILFPFVSAYLLIAELPLLALKFKSFNWIGNEFRFVLIISSILCVVLFQYLGIAIAIVLYILISIIHNFLISKHDKV